MKKEVDFTKGIRGKHAGLNLKIIGAAELIWAVCVTQADENLIPLKLYQIDSFANSDEVKVKNEKGETVFCPKTWFARLDVSPKIVGLLEKVA